MIDDPELEATLRRAIDADARGFMSFIAGLFNRPEAEPEKPAAGPRRPRIHHALHIGLNHVDPTVYDGWHGRLRGCLNDAEDMRGRFVCPAASSLFDEEATWDAVRREMVLAVSGTAADETCLITYSGHGGQRESPASINEADKKEETWCLWDGQIIDDYIYQTIVRNQRPGARVVVFSDSCHSGGMARLMSDIDVFPDLRPKAAPKPGESYSLQQPHLDFQRNSLRGEQDVAKGPVLWLAACQENQVAYDGERNGAFTAALKAQWDGGYRGAWDGFRAGIARRLSQQSPKLECFGPGAEEFVDGGVFA